MLKSILYIIIFIAFTSVGYSQEVWNLSKCVGYATENNIRLNQAYNMVASQEVSYMESKTDVLPNLNLGSDVSLNFGRNIDGNTNAVTFNQTMGNSYWVQSSVNIFQGFVKYNSIAFNKFLLSAQKQNAESERNILVFRIMTAYYTVLYSDGLARVAQNQVDLSDLQYNRMQKIVEVGKESPLTLQDLKSQWAADKLSLTQAKNNYNSTLLDLKQLLRINAHSEFVLDTLQINPLVVNPSPKIDSVFDDAITILPEIKQQEYLLNASEKDLAMAKGAISPRLTLSAGYGTSFYDGDSAAYNSQLTNNQNQWVNMSLVIPVFNGASTYSRIKQKQIALLNQQLELEKQKDNLYTTIWKAINDVQSAQNEYESSVELYDFSKLNLQNITLKMEKGLASVTDFQAAKQRFVSAEAGLLKAKLVYMMRNQMLAFYKTGNWEHL
ncbi:MAG: TolC family protein [Salinivirgaceae bacterium]